MFLPTYFQWLNTELEVLSNALILPLLIQPLLQELTDESVNRFLLGLLKYQHICDLMMSNRNTGYAM